jgi:coenzyme PQQ precursor peptide PqqA
MNWETPSFEEIDMSAEIGSYQGEEEFVSWAPQREVAFRSGTAVVPIAWVYAAAPSVHRPARKSQSR